MSIDKKLNKISRMLKMGTSSFDDVKWLKDMVKHHKMALKMSKEAVENAEHDELVELAKGIIKNQSAEIDKMNKWIKDWTENE